MQVYDAINALVIVLQSNVVFERAQIVTQVGAAGWADAGKDSTFFSHSYLLKSRI